MGIEMIQTRNASFESHELARCEFAPGIIRMTNDVADAISCRNARGQSIGMMPCIGAGELREKLYRSGASLRGKVGDLAHGFSAP